MDIREIWEADRLRTERVRQIPAGEALDETLSAAFGVPDPFWWGASNVPSVVAAALAYFRQHFPGRVDAFAQRLLDEVSPWATMYDAEVVLDDGRSSSMVLAILTAEPAAIVRAIILALPDRAVDTS